MTKTTQPEYNNLAVASLVLGVLSVAGMGPLTGIPAIFTGVMALKNPSSKNMAIAGIILGSLSIVLLLLIGLFILVLIVIGIAAAPYESSPMEPMDGFDSSFFQKA